MSPRNSGKLRSAAHRGQAEGAIGWIVLSVLAVLIIFYVLGCIVKLVLDKNFKEMDEPEEKQEESGEEQTQEQSDSDGEKKSE